MHVHWNKTSEAKYRVVEVDEGAVGDVIVVEFQDDQRVQAAERTCPLNRFDVVALQRKVLQLVDANEGVILDIGDGVVDQIDARHVQAVEGVARQAAHVRLVDGQRDQPFAFLQPRLQVDEGRVAADERRALVQPAADQIGVGTRRVGQAVRRDPQLRRHEIIGAIGARQRRRVQVARVHPRRRLRLQ